MNAPETPGRMEEIMENTMTFEEFKEVMDYAELDFDVLGFEGVLNIISMCYGFLEKEATRPYIKELYNEQHKKIFEELRKRGYYA